MAGEDKEQSGVASPGGAAPLSDVEAYAGEPPRLVVCLDSSPVDYPEGTTGEDTAFAESVLDVNDPKSVQKILEYVDPRIHKGLDGAWAGSPGKLRGWGKDSAEEDWAKAYTEVFFGARYGGPGQAYFSSDRWDSYIFSRIQKTSIDYFDPAIYKLTPAPKNKPGEPIKTPREPRPPATWLEMKLYANKLPSGQTIADAMTVQNADPAISLSAACQHSATYGAVSRGFTLEVHFDGSNLAAGQNGGKALFQEEKGAPKFPGAKWYKTNALHLDLKNAVALAPPMGPGSIYCYNPFGDEKFFPVWVPPHYTTTDSKGRTVVADPFVEQVANGRFEKKPNYNVRKEERVVDGNSSGELPAPELNHSGSEPPGSYVQALLPARGQRSGSHISFTLRVSDDQTKMQLFDTSNSGPPKTATLIVDSMPGEAGIYDGPAQTRVRDGAGFGVEGKYCGLGVLGPAPADLAAQAAFLRKARPIGLLRFVVTERVPVNKLTDDSVLFTSRLIRMYGDGEDDNFWISKCAWSLRNTPGFTSLQPWWIVFMPRKELAELMWRSGARTMSVHALAAKAFDHKTERFKQRPPIDRSKSNAVAASPPQPGLQHNEDYVDTVVLTSNQQGQAVYWCRKRSNLSYGATSESVEGQPIPGPIRALAAPMKPGGIAWDGEKASDRLVDPDTQAVDIQVPAFFRDGEAAGALVPPQKIASNNDGADGSTGQTAAPDESTADPVVLSEYGDDDAPEDAVADADEGDPGSGGAPAGAPPEPTAVA